MNISMDKKYTLDGKPFTVLTVTKPGFFPVLGYSSQGVAHEFTEEGVSFSFCPLVEISPYADFVIDEPVMVRDNESLNCKSLDWNKRNFAGVSMEGIARAWDAGYTKWTSGGLMCSWEQCRRPTAEELAT